MRKHTFRHATTDFPLKRRLRNERRNFRPRYSSSYYRTMREIFINKSNAPPRSESRHFRQYGISALVSQTSFGGETIRVAKCRLLSQATEVIRMVTQ